MIRNTKKAFTLVELIVVITILAILGTIAFISLQGYSGEAKNSKVTSDLRNIASAIETASTRNSIILSDVIASSWAIDTANSVTDTLTFNSGAALSTASTYEVGNVDFAAIGQNGEDFKDPNSANATADYLFGIVVSPTFKSYQLAGQIIENDIKKTRATGTYYKVLSTDTIGIISANGASGAPITDSLALPTGSTNLY